MGLPPLLFVEELMHPLEPKEVEKMAVTCIYVVQGKQVDKEDTTEHPGMDSFEREFGDAKKKKALFSWDHMDLKGQHIFIGHLL